MHESSTSKEKELQVMLLVPMSHTVEGMSVNKIVVVEQKRRRLGNEAEGRSRISSDMEIESNVTKKLRGCGGRCSTITPRIMSLLTWNCRELGNPMKI
nr:uncharacterized protein LOC109155346 [Ipomoea trifida]GMD50230.1 uncharacterized protein LOC109155346 [Ipomoea batatas]